MKYTVDIYKDVKINAQPVLYPYMASESTMHF